MHYLLFLLLALPPSEGYEFKVKIERISTSKISKALKLATALSSHTIKFKIVKDPENFNLLITKDCNTFLMNGRLAYAIPVQHNNKIIGGKIVIGCSKQSESQEVILHELGHILGFNHSENIALDRDGIILEREN